MSLDGVQESRSTSVSLDVYSVKYDKCKAIYPLRIIRPLDKYNLPFRPQLQEVLNDIQENDHTISDFVGDNPKRSNMREAKCFSSLYPCEYCTCRAVTFRENNSRINKNEKKKKTQQESIQFQIDFLKSTPGSSAAIKENEKKIAALEELLKELDDKKFRKKTQNVWPASTRHGDLRTRADIDNIVNLIEEKKAQGVNLSHDEAKGFVGKSAFLDIPNFDFVGGITCEYMHSTCIGVVKRMLELTYQVGEIRTRTTTRRLTAPSAFNILMKMIKVPREFPRRVRQLDFAVYKAQEFRNILLFFFPVVVETLDKTCKERKLWYLLAFAIRSCIVPNEEFDLINVAEINSACDKFYVLYEQLFSAKNCTYR